MAIFSDYGAKPNRLAAFLAVAGSALPSFSFRFRRQAPQMRQDTQASIQEPYRAYAPRRNGRPAAVARPVSAPRSGATNFVGFADMMQDDIRQLCRDRAFFVVEGPGGDISRHLHWMKQLASSLTIVDSLAQLQQQKPYGLDGAVVMIDIDQFEDTVEAVDAIQRFRSEYRMTPVIIGSDHFAQHDFSSERRSIADASVKLPVSRAALTVAISSAIMNNHDIY